MGIFIRGLALVVLALLASFYIAGAIQPSLSPTERGRLQSDGLAHGFVELSDGVVHFRAEGPQEAPTILFVHGFSTPSFVFDDYFAPLVAAGYRVISFDTYGRGLSDRPETDYNTDLFLRQINDLRAALNVRERVQIVGYSMGGGVVTDYAAAFPDMVDSITLLAPLGFSEVGGGTSILSAPVVGDWVMRVAGPIILRSYLEDGFEAAPDPDAFLEQFRAQSRYRGYYDALLSTMRNYPSSEREREHKKIASAGIEVRSFWGDTDEVISIDGANNLREWNPGAEITVLAGGTHAITYARSAEIIPKLLAGLGGQVTALPTD